MSDIDNTTDEKVDETTTDEAAAPAPIEVPLPEVVSQDAATIGDENLPAREPEFHVNEGQVDAQVAQPRGADRAKVDVHETLVVTDTVITDPSDPLAVQIPDAGRGDASLPIHRLAGPTVEQVFAEKAPEETVVSDEERAAASKTGTTAASSRGKPDES